jgi:hypothetical protein
MASGRVPKTVMTRRDRLTMTHWGPGLLRVQPRSQTRLSNHFSAAPERLIARNYDLHGFPSRNRWR